jgi:hypothetical protein
MREDAPQTPPGANLVGNATRGPRVMPGNYTVRLTKGTNVYTMPVTIMLDRRATFTVADRKAQYDAAERVSGLFARMSELAGKIVEVRDGAKAIAKKVPESDALHGDLERLADDADALRKKIVATKEGGAITGEERLREHMDFVYGAIMSTEDRPTPYQLARVDVLERELRDVENDFATLSKGELATVNEHLKAKSMEKIAVLEPVLEPAGGGGDIRAVASGLVGLHAFAAPLTQEANQDERD